MKCWKKQLNKRWIREDKTKEEQIKKSQRKY